MNKNKQTKIMVIVSLCVAILCLTLGFAAFSNTLTISSSATVTPNASDFKMVAYGIDPNLDVTFSNVSYDPSIFTSMTTTKSLTSHENYVSFSEPVIETTTSGIKISNISVNFKDVGIITRHYFMIKNEGKYTAYLSSIPENFETSFDRICTAEADATPTLVEAACADIRAWGTFDNANLVNGSYVIEPGEYIFVTLNIGYGSGADVADGEFEAKFEDFEFNFSTVA